MPKLTWDYDSGSGDYVARYKGLRIRAVFDDCLENPFDDDPTANWPMIVNTGRRGDSRSYNTTLWDVEHPLRRFNDQLLVLLQKHITDALGVRIEEICFDENGEPVRWERYPDVLRYALEGTVEPSINSRMLDECEKLYGLLDIPCLRKQVHGYCQGDWADLLIVAVPEAVELFGTRPEHIPASLEAQAEIYADWAFGNVYGYVVEREIAPDDEDDDPEWEQLDSCWGFYGSDFEKSGLEEAAMSFIDHHQPKEKADVYGKT